MSTGGTMKAAGRAVDGQKGPSLGGHSGETSTAPQRGAHIRRARAGDIEVGDVILAGGQWHRVAGVRPSGPYVTLTVGEQRRMYQRAETLTVITDERSGS